MLDLKSVALLGAVTVTSIALALGIAWTLLNTPLKIQLDHSFAKDAMRQHARDAPHSGIDAGRIRKFECG